jgi:hypothetical protein
MQVNNLQNNLYIANYVLKAFVTGNSSSTLPQSFRDPNAMNINASIILELTNLLSLVFIVSNICKVWQKYMTPCCSCCGSICYKYMVQLHPNITCNHYHWLNHYICICLTRLLKSCGFKAASQWIAASASSVFSLSPAPLSHAPTTVSASIANVDKLEQENAQLKNSVTLF